MKRVELSHFEEYGIRPFCDQLSLHFRKMEEPTSVQPTDLHS